LLQINSLQITTDLEDDEVFFSTPPLDFFALSEMVIFPINFGGTRCATIAKDRLFQLSGEFWIEFDECLMQRPFAYT